MAPGGVVVVWLLGVQSETEVASFQAKETNIDINNVSDEAQSQTLIMLLQLMQFSLLIPRKA